MFTRLKETWKRLSTHPTWSNVIGAVIVAIGAWTLTQLIKGITAVAQSQVTGRLTTQVWQWLRTPVPTARIWVLASSIVYLALIISAASVWYRAREREAKRRAALAEMQGAAVRVERAREDLQRQAEAAEVEIRNRTELERREARERREQSLLASREAAELAKAERLRNLNEKEQHALRFLYRVYPGRENLMTLAGMVGMSYGRAEKLVEELQELKLVTVTNNPFQGTFVGLTEQGRDLCIEQGMADR